MRKNPPGRRPRTRSAFIAAALTVAIALPLAWLQHNSQLTPFDKARSQARERVIEKLKTKQAKPFDKPDEAPQFFLSKRSPDGQPMAVSPLEEAAEAAAETPLHTTLGATGAGHTTSAPLGGTSEPASASGTLAGGWQANGPGSIGGRSRALLIHRTKNNLCGRPAWLAGSGNRPTAERAGNRRGTCSSTSR